MFLKHKLTEIFILLSIFFVLLSFSPSLFELINRPLLPRERTFVLEHNYMFDFNFYLSRIKEGQEGRLLVLEKYYNQPHQGSLIQIIYLIMGRFGSILRLSPTAIYHLARLSLGFVFLFTISQIIQRLFKPEWSLIAFLLIVTSSSFPILLKAGNFWRFASYMGWWSVLDSLQRITFIPHILFGQLFLLILLYRYSNSFNDKYLVWLGWGLIGFIVGIVFPPTLLILFIALVIISLLEFIIDKKILRSEKKWFKYTILPRIIFIIISSLSFVYMSIILKEYPWKALVEFDIKHRFIMPYMEYILALGPTFILGILGLVVAFIKGERKYIPFISWILAVGVLFFIFEHVPQQSALRFTEAAIHIPLGILSAYLLLTVWQASIKFSIQMVKIIKLSISCLTATIIILGLGVMVSDVFWLTDQAIAKRVGTFIVPTGAQLIYPLKDFMDGIYFLRDKTKIDDIVLAYETAGNYIPAYAGNFVFLGHANTPQEDEKKAQATKFFSAKMNQNQAKEFLDKEKISYIYFGPQEKDLGNIKDLEKIYPFLELVYQNSRVMVYKVVMK